jgi:spore germination protein GerM
MADTAPVATAVGETIKQHAGTFPKGVMLKSVTVKAGVAALDFSPEFNRLTSMGESTESGVQKQLRAALAQFPAIETMTVTVDGKPFDSQATDWTTPFPVRKTADEKDAAADASQAATGAGGGVGNR